MLLLQRFIFLTIFIFGMKAAAGLKVEYRISKMQGFLSFALANAGYDHLPPGLVEIFVKSPYNTDEIKKTLMNLKNLQRSLHINFESHSETKHRGYGQSVLDLIIIQSVFSKDLKDLSNRVLGLMPPSDHALFFQELKKLEPAYGKLIWKDLSPRLTQHKAQLEKLARTVRLDEMFTNAEKFYNAKWPADTPFVISLYPIPYIEGGFQNSSSSQSLKSVETHGVIIRKGSKGKNSLAGSFGVIFHELCHSIYGAQEDSFQLELENHFLKSPSPFAPYAYTWLNEALATAIGNGWAYARANNGKSEKESWYNNPTIDGYAREIYPVVQETLEKGQSIDGELVAKLIGAYERRFPKAIFAFDNLLNRLILSHDGRTMSSLDLRRDLKKGFQVYSLNISAPLDHDKSVKSILEHEQDNLLFVFSDKEKNQLQKMAEGIPYIKENLKDLLNMKTRSIFAAVNDKGRAYIFVKIENQKDWVDSIASLSQKSFIDPATKIWSY